MSGMENNCTKNLLEYLCPKGNLAEPFIDKWYADAYAYIERSKVNPYPAIYPKMDRDYDTVVFYDDEEDE